MVITHTHLAPVPRPPAVLLVQSLRQHKPPLCQWLLGVLDPPEDVEVPPVPGEPELSPGHALPGASRGQRVLVAGYEPARPPPEHQGEHAQDN